MKRSKKQFVWLFAAIAAILVLLGWNTIASYIRGGSDAAGVPCVNPVLPVPPQLHIHPHLAIIADGKEIKLEPNIGLELAGCHRALHTHDATGEIHVEPNYPQDFTLGQFFALWGKPFSREQVLDFRADAVHEIVMTVGGEPSDAFGELILKDKQQILLEYRKR